MLPDGGVNPGVMTSFNQYALGSVGAFLHGFVGGISPLEPGWKKVRIEPRPGGTVVSATARHVGPYGEVSCHWRIDEGDFIVHVVVPPNSMALGVLPRLEEEIGSGEREYVVPYEGDERWPPQSVQHAFMNRQDKKLVT
jgi:alpha-L-rhamnosidase